MLGTAYPQYQNLWIGASDSTQEGGWEWSDGSPFSYLHWHPGQSLRVPSIVINHVVSVDNIEEVGARCWKTYVMYQCNLERDADGMHILLTFTVSVFQLTFGCLT